MRAVTVTSFEKDGYVFLRTLSINGPLANSCLFTHPHCFWSLPTPKYLALYLLHAPRLPVVSEQVVKVNRSNNRQLNNELNPARSVKPMGIYRIG